MRITTQMLNETSRKAGVPLHTTSMLSYVQNKGKTNTLPYDLNIENESKTIRKTQAYEKQGKEAKRLESAAKELASQEEDSVYERAKRSGDNTELFEKITELVKQYNEVLSGFEGSTDLLDSFYRQNLKALVKDHEKPLQELGITADKNGRLSVNESVLHDVNPETVKQALSGEDGFADSLSFLASKIADYAESNQQSTHTYRSDGSEAGAARYTSRYDAWG